MAPRIYILDFKMQDLIEAATPKTIAGTSKIWEREINHLGPWEKMPPPFLEVSGNEAVWQAGHGTDDAPAVFVCGQCTSTMDVAWHFIENRQFQVWDSVIAVAQAAGRGQQKREWISPAGNIHASWLLPLPELNREWATKWDGLLSLMAGFILARAFKELNVPVKMKWPNDLLINNRKCAGILVERRGSHILAGMGINVVHSPDDQRMREDAAVPATSLAAMGVDMSPLDLWLALTEIGKKLFESIILTLTPSEFVRLVDKQMAWVGEKVLIRQANAAPFEGVISGMAGDGGLRVKKGNTEEVVYSASIIPL